MSNTEVRFWGGSTAFNNTIRPLEANSFKDLVEAYIFIPVMRPNMTRAEYHLLTDDEQKKVKDCPFVCACNFKPDAQRCDADAENVVLVIVDLDEGGGEFFESPESLSEALYPYNFAMWTTATHTPEKPRLKVMVDVKECDKKWHKPLARHVIRLLGLDPKFKGSIETKVLSQPQYRPIQFKGEEFTCVLSSRTDGIQLNHVDLPAEEETEDNRIFAWDGELGSDLAYLPLEGLTVEEIREPLFAISADIDYRPWTMVAAALRHQFREEPMAREAFELFEEWSATGDKFRDGDAYYKWRNFRPDTIGKAPTTIRTLFFMAKEAGWDGKKITSSYKKLFLTWLDNCDDEDILFDEGCKKIATMPFTDKVAEDIMAQALQAKVQKVTGYKPAKKAVDEQLAHVKRVKRAEKVSKEVPNWLQPYCYISTTNKFCNVINGVDLIPDAFDSVFSIHLLNNDTSSGEANTARPAILPKHFALNQIGIKRVDGKMYDPRNGGDEPYFNHEGRHYLNTYLPSSLPDVDPDNAEEAGRLFLQHLDAMIEEREYRDHVLHFLCHVVQFPGEKVIWAPVIQSGQGAGKGFLREILRAVFGHKNVKEVDAEVLQEKYNDWMVGAVMIILDEVHIPGQRREAVANSLKKFVTDPSIPIMAKYLNVETDVPNLTNAIAFTNYQDAFHLSESDRRWMCIESKLQCKEDIDELKASGHFTRMEPLKGRLGGALRHWMLTFKIPDSFSKFDSAPDTIYRREVVEGSKNPMLKAIEDTIAAGSDPLIAADLIHGKRIEAATEFLSRGNGNAFRYLKQLGFTQADSGKVCTVAGEPTTIWIHRRKFDPDMGTAEEQLNDRVREEVIA